MGLLGGGSAHTHEHTQTSVISTYRRELRVSVQQSNFRTVNFVYYLDGVKSATLAFHYSAGNNFIKLEQWLELAKGVSVIEKLYSGRDAARALREGASEAFLPMQNL